MKLRLIITVSLSIIVFILPLTGCAPVGPNYVKPEKKVSDNWHTELKDGLTAEEMNPAVIAAWWNTFNDEELSSLIGRAVAGNLDVKQAQSRVVEARVERGIAQADLFPTLDFSGSDKWIRNSNQNGNGKTTELYSAGFDAGWEIDVFGGVRRSIEASQADLEASQEDLHDVLVTLAGEVALNYIEVRTFQARIATVNENINAQNETYQLIQWRSQAGLSDELALQQSLYNLESSRAEIPILHTNLEEAMNRIAVLLGEEPGAVHAELEKTAGIPVPPATIAVGVPAETIRRRPDIRVAERELAAQTARIGVATADLYPKFTLSGSIGVEAAMFSQFKNNIGNSHNWILSGGPGVSWAIFQGGAIRQNIKVQTARQEQALLTYESTILNAIEEVENALVSYSDEQNRMDNLTKATQAARKAVDLAQHEYEAGLVDFSNVLDAQRSLRSFEDQLAQSKGTVTSNLVRVYKALGGGWTSFDTQNNENKQVKK
jgi:NodT family efflux transporter outer membrane factor (OMF) lipoprotein